MYTNKLKNLVKGDLLQSRDLTGSQNPSFLCKVFMQCLERRRETGIEIEDFFRDLSPRIHRSAGERPVIHSLGKERILAGPIEQLQVKKGRGHPYSSPLIQSRSDARSPRSSVRPPCGTSSTTSEPQVVEHSGFSLMRVRCQFFLHCLLVELSEMF